MLYKELLTEELHNQRNDFVDFVKSQESDLTKYLKALRKISQLSNKEIQTKLAEIDGFGAVPSKELDFQKDFSLTFGTNWKNHEEARSWANSILQNRTTFAADGSQLYAEKETSLPVGAIQIGWFENPHNKSQPYEKNADFKIISPKELLENKEEPLRPENLIGQKRFEAEIQKAKEFLDKHKGWQERGEKMPIAFYDGTLMLSISSPKTDVQETFTKELVELVKHSVFTKVPIVGYVDRSFSRDLLHFIDALEENSITDNQTLYDATILSSKTPNFEKILKNWGDRTCFCYSKRKNLDAFVDSKTNKSIVGFTYLQTTANSNPARIDIPTWIYEEGLLDEIINVIRAECVIGLGYPYVLETADVTAVISNKDRQIFIGALQKFSEDNNLNFSFPQKGSSKNRRRYS